MDGAISAGETELFQHVFVCNKKLLHRCVHSILINDGYATLALKR